MNRSDHLFIGRQREITDLKSVIEDALSGRGRMVTLVGEPGIGKTRTAEELAVHAALRGAKVLWGRCYEDVGAPPYWPWVQAIRSYVAEREPEELRSEMGPGAADIAEIVSEVREKLPDLEAAPPLDDPEQTRFRLFVSIAAFLKGASAAQPLVVMLDDLHWADKPSLRLLEFVAREVSGARLLLIGAYRDMDVSRGDPLAQTLGELTRDRLFERVLLRGMTEEDVSRFLEVATGLTPLPGLASDLHARTEGNPLFVTEVVRLLVQEGELTPERLSKRTTWTVRIPEGVREVIGRRLDRLSELCNETLTVASVIGREFEMAKLDRLMDPSTSSGQDLSEDWLLDVLEEALSARIIEELPAAVGRYQFTHSLVQETLVEELSLTRRARLHARIAETLEALYGPEAEANAAELAHHFVQAEPVLGNERLVGYSLIAGEFAMASHGYEEATAHFQRALTAKESQPMDSETAAALFGLGLAQAATTVETSRAQQAWDHIQRAFEYYVESGDTAGAVSVAQHTLRTPHLTKGRVDVTARALEFVPPDSLDAGRLLAQYGYSLFFEEKDYDGAHQSFDRAIAIAQRLGDTALEAGALAYSLFMDLNNGRHERILEIGPRAIELAQRANDLLAEERARRAVAGAMMETGDSVGARQHATANLEVAESLRHPDALASLPTMLGVLSRLEGDWQTAHRFFDRALEGIPDFPNGLVFKALAYYQVGDTEAGDTWLERLMTLARDGSGQLGESASMILAWALPLVSYITGTDRDLDLAERTAKAAPDTFGGMLGLAMLAVHRSDAEAAAEQYQGLRSQRRFTGHDRLLGLVAHTMGKFDVASSHFEDALDFSRKAGYRPALAWSCCDYAHTLRGRDGDGDSEKALALLNESLSIARDLGMRPLEARAVDLLEQLEARAAAPSFPDGLTQREVEVLRLIIAGATNQDIAGALFITTNTVANHVKNILSKSNTENRTAAATYGVRHGLAED